MKLGSVFVQMSQQDLKVIEAGSKIKFTHLLRLLVGIRVKDFLILFVTS